MGHVAVLGTGLLGSGFVEAMRGRSLAVRVWNRSPEKAAALAARGATVATDPADAARGAERIHLVLADDAAVDEVIARAWPAIDAPVIDHSTVSPAGVVRRAAQFAAAGRVYVHAPVFMSPQNARDAAGIILVSGPPAAVQPLVPVLEAMTGKVQVLGERVDAAAAFKLFGNAANIAMVAAIADILALARAQGIDEQDALALFTGFDPSPSMRIRGGRIARRDFHPASFTLAMARKDVGLMLAAAGDTPLFVLPAVAARMDEALAAGEAGADFSVIGRPRG